MDFAGLPMVKQSFMGVHLHAPIPGSSSKSLDRDAYKAYQQYLHVSSPAGEAGSTSGLSFLEWWRRHQIKKKTGDAETQEATLEVKDRGKFCAVGVQFLFELLAMRASSHPMAVERDSPITSSSWTSAMTSCCAASVKAAS